MPIDIYDIEQSSISDRYKTQYDEQFETLPEMSLSVGRSKYDEGYIYNQQDPYESLQEQRARQQSWTAQLGSALNQAVVGEIIGGTIEGLGYLLDVEQYGNLAAGTEQEFGNWFSNIGKGLRTWSEEATPIYTDPNQDKFAPGHWSWWMSNAPSVASTLSLMIPAAGAVKGLSMLGKATGIANEMGLATRWAAKGITQAVVSRHMENVMEASGTFNELYNEALSTGMSDEEAKKKASIGASESYKMNWVMLAQDIPQYLLLNRAFSKASLDNTIATARAMGKSLTPVFGKKGAAIGWDMATEGGEEAYQFVVGEEAKYHAQKAYDPSIESSFSDRLSEYTSNGDFWTSAFFGALGAGVVQTAGKQINNLLTGKKDVRVEDIQSWGQQFSHWNQRLKEAQEDGDEIAERYVKDNLWSTLAVKSASVGNSRNAMDFLQAMQNPTKEELEQFGVSEEDLNVFKSEIPKGIEKMKRTESLYNQNVRNYEPNRAAYITQLQLQLEDAVDHRDNLQNQITDKVNKLSYLNDLFKLPFVSNYLTTKMDLDNANSRIKMFTKLLDKGNLSNREKDTYTNALEESKRDLETYTNQVSEIEEGFKTEDKKWILEEVNNTIHPSLTEYKSLKQQLDLFDNHVKSLQTTIKQAQSNKPISTEEERVRQQENEKDVIEVERETVPYTPTQDDIVDYTDPETGEIARYRIEGDNEDGTYDITPIDENDEDIKPSDPTNPITKKVNKDSVTLNTKKKSKEDRVSEEPVNDSDIPVNRRKAHQEAKKGLKSAASAITNSGLEYTSEVDEKGITSTKIKAVVRNKEFDKYLSTPTNTLKGDSISFSIDTSTEDQYKTRFWEQHKAIRDKIVSGQKLSESEIDNLLSIAKVSGKETYNNLVDRLPIKVTYTTSSGQVYDKGLYYHDSDYSDERHLVIPPDVTDKDAYIENDRLKTRSNRRAILKALLSGNEVTLKNISKTRGVPNNTKKLSKIDEILGIDASKIALGISDSTESIWTGGSVMGKSFNPGHVYFQTTKTANGELATIRGNISKVSREHAEILWDAILTKYYGKGGNQKIFPDDRVTGELTVGQVIDLLVTFGNRTNPAHPDNADRDMTHLYDKQLWVESVKGEGPVLHFGADSVALRPFFTGKISDVEAKEMFIQWATTKKNYIVPKYSPKNSGLGFELNKPTGKDFTIGSWNVSKDMTLAESFIRSGRVMTDLQEYEGTGSLFYAPVTIIDITETGLEVKPNKQQQAKQTTTNKSANTAAKKAQASTPKVEVGDRVVLKSDKKITRSIVRELPDGTNLFVATTIKEVGTDVEETKVTPLLSIRNGKFYTTSPILKMQLGLPYEDKKEKSVEINDDSVSTVTMYINGQDLVYADTKNTVQATTETKPTEDVQTDVTPEQPQQSEQISTEDIDFSLLGTSDTDFGKGYTKSLERLVDSIENYPKWNPDKELAWLKNKLSSTSVEVQEGIIEIAKYGKKAFGQLRKDSILLSNVAAEGTAYHEAYHRVSLMYLDDNTRQSIYNEAKKKYSDELSDKASNLQVEEFLAEKFREYVTDREVNQKPTSVIGKIGEWFRQLYELVKSVFTGDNKLTDIDIDHLFESIQQGKYRYNKPLADNVRNFIEDYNLEYREVLLDKVDTYKQFKNIIGGLSAELLSGVKEQLFGDPKFKYSTIDVIDSVEKVDFNGLKSNVEAQLNKQVAILKTHNAVVSIVDKNQLTPELSARFKELLGVDTTTQMKEKASLIASKAINLRDLYQEILDNYDNLYKPAVIDYIYTKLSIREINNENEEEDINNKEIGNYDKQPFEFSAKDNIQGAIKFLISNLRASVTQNPNTGFYDLAPINEVWSRLLNDLYKADTIEEMMSILEANTNYYPYSELLAHLKRGTPLLRTQFQNTFKLHRHNFVNTLVELTVDEEGNTNYSFRFIDADIHSASKQTLKEWNNNLASSDLFSQDKLNLTAFREIQRDYKTLKDTLDYKTKSGKVDITKEEINEIIDKLLPILTRVGVNVDPSTINTMIVDNVLSGNGYNPTGALYYLINRQIDPLFSESSSFIQYNSGKSKLTPKTILSNESVVSTLAEAFIKVNPQDTSDTTQGPEGNKHYKYSAPTYITDIIKRLKKEPEFIKTLKSDMLGQGSYVLDLLENESIRNNVDVATFNSIIINNTGDEGRGYLDMSPVEDFLYKLNAIRQGYLILPTLADRKTYYTLKGLNLKNINYIIDKDGNKVLPEEVINIFYNYAKAERARIEQAKVDIEAAKLAGKSKDKFVDKDENNEPIDVTRLVENYHYVKDGKLYNTKKANGVKHIIFPYLENKTEAEFKDEIRKDLETNITNAFDYAKELGIIEDNTNFLLDNNEVKLLTEQFGGDKHLALRSIIADFELKTRMSGIETMMLFMGDISYYKNPDDYVKRLSVVTSSGYLLRENIPAEFENEQYNAATFTRQRFISAYHDTLLNKQFNLVKDKYLAEGRTEEWIRKMLKSNLKAYREVDATDAQVLISPEMHREISIRRGEWSQKEEDAYNLLQSTEKISPEQEQQLLDIVMQPLKYVYFDRIAEDISDNKRNLIPTYDKMSLATLFRRFTKDTYLDEVLDRMEAKGKYEFTIDSKTGDKVKMDKIHMIKYETAVKSGNRRRTDFIDNLQKDNEAVSDLSNMSSYKQNFRYLRHQVVTDPHHTLDVLFGSQAKKVPQANILEDADYMINGVATKGKDVRNNINKALGLLSDKGILKLHNKLGRDKDGRIDLDMFYNTLIEEAKNSNMPETVLEALRGDFKPGSTNRPLPIDLLADRKWIYQRFISQVNKYGVDLKLPGNQLVQMSGFGLGKLGVKDAKDKTNNLKFFFDGDKIIGIEAMVSVQLFRNVIPGYKDKSYEDKVKWLKDNNQVLEGLGYRIPTQGQNSTVPITVVEFLPENIGDVIVLPNEFTSLTGSDFDIDKLFFVRYNYYIDKEGVAKKYELSTGTSDKDIQKRYDELAMEIFDDAPIIDKESHIKLLQLKKARFEFKSKTADLFGENGTIYNALVKQYVTLLDLVDSAIRGNNPSLVDNYLKEAKTIEYKLVESNVYTEGLDEIQDEILAERELIKNILVKNEVLPTIEEFRGWDVYKQNTRKAIQNLLLDNYRGVLLSDNNFIGASTPLGSVTGDLQDLAAEVTQAEGKSRGKDFLGVVAQAEIKYKYSGGKGGVGPEALNNVHHIMCQVANVSFNYNIGIGLTSFKYRIKEGDNWSYIAARDANDALTKIKQLGVDIESLDTFDDDGYGTALHGIDSLADDKGKIVTISDWLSALIDAHVDIAKDPYIISLNVVGETYNVANLLVRIGMGKKTFEFLPQPILKDLVKESLYEEGEVKLSRSQKPEDIVREKYEGLLNKFSQDEIDNAYEIVPEYDTVEENNKLAFSFDLLDLIKTPEKDRNALWYVKQLKILEVYRLLNKYGGQHLNSLVKASRVDTKKYATDLISNELYIRALNDVVNDANFTNLDKLLGYNPELEQAIQEEYGTFLASYIKNAPLALRELFADQTMTGTKSFQNAVFRVAKLAGIGKFTKNYPGKINKIADEVFAALMSRFFTNKDEMNLSKENIKSILDYVPAFLRDVNDKYPELRSNTLVQSLVKGIDTQDNITFTGIPSIKSEDSNDREELMFAWKELLSSSNKDIVSFAKRLYVYSYFTSGYKPGPYTIFNHIPSQLHRQFNEDINFSDFTYNLLLNMQDEELGNIKTQDIEDEIFRNNWFNTALVPKVYEGSKRQIGTDRYTGDPEYIQQVHNRIHTGTKGEEQLVIASMLTTKEDKKKGSWVRNINLLGTNQLDQPIYQPYVLFQIDKENSVLMQYVGYHNDKYKTPVYKTVEKMGYYSKGRRVVEYGLDKSILPINNINVISDEQVLTKTSKNRDYNDFIYIAPEYRVVSDLLEEESTSPIETTTEDRSLNVEANLGQESSPNDNIAQDRLQNRLEDNKPLC